MAASSKQPPTPPKESASATTTEVQNTAEKPKDDPKTGNNDTEPLAVEPPAKAPKETAESDAPHKLKKKAANTGFKSMFGTSKKKDPEGKPPLKPTGAEGSAVAAARAALEGKAKASQEQPPSRNGPATLKKKPVPSAAPAKTTGPDTETAPEPAAVPAPEPQPSEPQVTEPAREPMGDHPQIRREAEYDALSRVDTNEQVAADREFSRFDQGPLVDQPAFVPEDSPVEETPPKADPSPPVSPISPSSPSHGNASQDRWAQIRKNAAERVQAEPRASTADEDGNTSEEESKYLGHPAE